MAYNLKSNQKIPSQLLKLHDWIDPHKLLIENLCDNLNAEFILRDNIDQIDWIYLSQNPYCVSILEENQNMINWYYISDNENAMKLIENNLDKINWDLLAFNPKMSLSDL